VEGAQDIVVITQDGIIKFINQAVESYGYSVQELLGKSFLDLVVPEIKEEVASKYSDNIADNSVPSLFTARVLRKDGSPVDVEASSVVIQSEGKPAILAIARDITERKRAEEELSSFFNVSPDLMAVASPKSGRFTKVSPACLDILGYSQEEFCSRPFEEFIHPDDRESTAATVSSQLKGNPVAYFENRYRHKDGSYRWLSWMATPSLKGVVFGVARDVTASKQAEAEKEELQTRLYQADKMTTVGQLASGIAHEINNPIGFVLPNLQWLQEHFALLQQIVNLYESGAPESEIAEFRKVNKIGIVMDDIPGMLSDCLEGARRVRDTTRELRQFSRGDEEATEKTNLSDLVDSSLTIAANEIKYRAKVIKRYSDIPEVMVNRGKMSQVFLNLIMNAGQTIEEGHVEDNWIRVTTGQQDDKVFVEIANNGPIIPADILPKIFDPFFSTKPQDQATGLGLSISYSIVQQLGGVISVESSAEQDTAFRVWLPLDNELGKQPVQSRAAGAETDRPGRILVIDDEAGILRHLRRFLEPPHLVVTATSGKEALEILTSDQSFDVVLCDLMMPEISGMELFEKVRSDHPQLSARFIFMTGGIFTPMARKFVEHIDNLIIEKPIDHVALQAGVSKLMTDQR